MSILVICMGCGELGETERPVPEMLHACGSKSVDVWMDTPDQRRVVARKVGPEPVFAEFMRTAAQPPMPRPTESTDTDFPVGDEVAGWNEYTGPGPTPNGRSAPVHTDLNPREPTRPVPGDTKQDSNAYVYNKHQPLPPTTEAPPDPLVAEHEYPAPFVTKTPFLGQRKKAPTVRGFPLTGASCPRCGAADTAIVADDREHAHWYCSMRLCGSLVDLDKHPEVDPYHPQDIRDGKDEFWHGKRVSAARKDGQLMRRMATITRVNPGLGLSEVVHLARQSVIQYPEA